MVILYKTLADTGLRHGSFIVALQKKASGVTEHFWLENEYSWQRRFDNLHGGVDRLPTFSEHAFPKQLLQVQAVAIALHRGCGVLQLLCRNVPVAKRNLFRTRDHEPLARCDRLDKK